MKYVRHDKLGIFLFPNFGGNGASHRDITVLLNKFILEGSVISAGFASFKNKHFLCHGYSQSTGLESLDGDSRILNEQFNIPVNISDEN